MARIQKKRKVTPRLVPRIGVAVALFVALVVFRSSLNVRSAAITEGAVEQLKTNGVITIAPGGATDSVMKVGNHGNIITSTGSIYIRPNGTTAGSRFIGNADTTQDLIMTGKIEVAGSISINGQPKTIWPEPDNWTSITSGPYSNLYPNDTGLRVDSGNQQDTREAYGLGIYESSAIYSALSIGNSDGPAIDFNANTVDVRGSLNILSGYLYVKLPDPSTTYKRAWTIENDGKNSGLSADLIDGTDTYFANCGSSVCLCAVATAGQNHCQNLDSMLYY